MRRSGIIFCVCLVWNAVSVQSFLSNVPLKLGNARSILLSNNKRAARWSLKTSLRMGAPPKLEGEVFGKERLLQEEADIVKMEKQGMGKKEVTFQDVISLWVTNIVLTYGDKEKYANLQDGAVVSEGVIDDLVGGPLFLPLYKYFRECGGFYKLVPPQILLYYFQIIFVGQCFCTQAWDC
jgi:hypothetical protein